DGTPLNICGGNGKTFIGRSPVGRPLDVSRHSGIINYDPRELVITARAGTLMSEIEATLAESGQMLAFEPPHFGSTATLGGTIACGLSGSRRPFSGSARDFTLGCKVLNGRGEILNFGGQVMKNVAGYDLSRLMVGAYGTLGVLLDISLKVLPRPASSQTLKFECTPAQAITRMSGLLSQPYPVDAACFHGERLHLRLSGSKKAVKHAQVQLGGEVMPDSTAFWRTLNEHELTLFTTASTLYRVMVKPATPPLTIDGKWLLGWAGAQRWLVSNAPVATIREQVAKVSGHVTQFRGGDRNGSVFSPLAPALMPFHQRLKASFDPHGIFNRGRMYAEI
ncbi:MAG: glycolate oxidase subunit GlcE, partial [Gallionella sp.]